MDYAAYGFEFCSGVHFGRKSLEDSGYALAADTLFSALYQECLHFGQDECDRFYNEVKAGRLLLSDAFPYIGDALFIPKPMVQVEHDKSGDSKAKKAFKKLGYIPVSEADAYLSGRMDIFAEQEKLAKLGYTETRVLAAVRGQEETKPYRVGIYHFGQGNGLYIIVGYENRDMLDLMEKLLKTLSYSGIGGKKHSGLGRFELCFKTLPDSFLKRLRGQGNTYMTLSVSLPRDEELRNVLLEAEYKLIKRSGFVDSMNYADSYLRKKDLYVFAAGASVTKKYLGDIYDVSSGGSHSVYRYAKPIFMEVGI